MDCIRVETPTREELLARREDVKRLAHYRLDVALILGEENSFDIGWAQDELDAIDFLLGRGRLDA